MTSYKCRSCGKDFEPEDIRDGSCPYCGTPVTVDQGIEPVTDADKQAEIYGKAVALTKAASSFGEWETAGKLFASLTGYKDADSLAAVCRQKAEEAQKEAIYSQAVKRQGTTAEALRGKAALLRTVAGYKDADALAEEYEEQAAALEADRMEARREQQEKKLQETAIIREKSGKRRRVIFIFAAAAAVVLAAVLIVSLWVIPKGQYDQGIEKFNAGDYTGAKEIFDSIPHYRDSADYLGRINGHLGEDALQKGDYRGALQFFEQTGGRAEFKPRMEEVLDILHRQAMEEFQSGQYAAAQKDFDEVDKYPGYETARAYKQLCRAIRLWNKEEGVNEEKLNVKDALPAIRRIADGMWYCEATGNEISPTPLTLEENLLKWQGYTVEFHSATTLTLTGSGDLAGEYEKE